MADKRKCIFNETLTIEQFKARMLVDKIYVKENPRTKKLFLAYGAKVGAVSEKGIPEHPMVSDVTGDDGSRFWLLHEEGKGPAVVLKEF